MSSCRCLMFRQQSSQHNNFHRVSYPQNEKLIHTSDNSINGVACALCLRSGRYEQQQIEGHKSVQSFLDVVGILHPSVWGQVENYPAVFFYTFYNYPKPSMTFSFQANKPDIHDSQNMFTQFNEKQTENVDYSDH